MVQKANTGRLGILIVAIILVVSVLLLIDRLLSTGPIQLVLEDGRAVPVEGVSYFSLNDVLFFIITAWLGGMSFLYIIQFSRNNETPDLKIGNPEGAQSSSKNITMLVADLLEGDEKILFQRIVDTGEILQRELILKTGFSEPKVSRLLDRLERKGLIIRQRDGMGNRVLLKEKTA